MKKWDSNKYIKLIHVCKQKACIDDETYREILKERYNKQSSKELTIKELEDFYNFLMSKIKYNPYENLKGRQYFATDKQLRLIAALWKEKSFIKDPVLREKALNKFIKRIVGVDNIRFLLGRDVNAVVTAIKNIKTNTGGKQ